jgi:hypothetical protein
MYKVYSFCLEVLCRISICVCVCVYVCMETVILLVITLTIVYLRFPTTVVAEVISLMYMDLNFLA